MYSDEDPQLSESFRKTLFLTLEGTPQEVHCKFNTPSDVVIMRGAGSS